MPLLSAIVNASVGLETMHREIIPRDGYMEEGCPVLVYVSSWTHVAVCAPVHCAHVVMNAQHEYEKECVV